MSFRSTKRTPDRPRGTMRVAIAMSPFLHCPENAQHVSPLRRVSDEGLRSYVSIEKSARSAGLECESRVPSATMRRQRVARTRNGGPQLGPNISA
jgi:hypothetical protein